jgi:hypothetical protein
MDIVYMVAHTVCWSRCGIGNGFSLAPQDPTAVRINPNEVVREDSLEN